MGEGNATPRPWRETPAGVTMQGYSQSRAIVYFEERNQETLIAGCFSDVRGGPVAAEANAELIVRAVNAHDDLVAACETALDSLKGNNGFMEVYSDEIRELEAALAKARKERNQ